MLEKGVKSHATLYHRSLAFFWGGSAGCDRGYLIAFPLLVIIILLAPQIILSTIFQRTAGVPFTTGEMVGPVAGFVVLGFIATWLLVSLLRDLMPYA